jgi:hypothetical protein
MPSVDCGGMRGTSTTNSGCGCVAMRVFLSLCEIEFRERDQENVPGLLRLVEVEVDDGAGDLGGEVVSHAPPPA